MTDLETLLDRIEAGRTALADAIAAAASRWEEPLLVAEDPAEAAWSPRDAAEHCLSGEQMYVRLIDEALTAEAPPSFLDFVTALDWNWAIRSSTRSSSPTPRRPPCSCARRARLYRRGCGR